MQKIIIYLTSSDLSQLAWVQVDENGNAAASEVNGNLETLAHHAHQDHQEIIIIAAAEDVLLTEIKLPKLTPQRLLQALPFALEEQLLSDVNDSHFATGPYQLDGLPVAIVAKQKIEAWLAAFKQIGLTPTAIYPACLATPVADNYHWHITIFGDSVMVRTGAYTGFACDKHNLETLLALHLAEKPQEASTPVQIYIENYSLQPFVTSLPEAVLQHGKPEDFLLSLSKNYQANTTINLLQGPYRPRRKAAYTQKVWKWASILAASWLALVFLGNVVSLLILHHETSKLETAINTIYKRNFPQATSVVAPKARMTEKLDTLTNQNHKNRLLLWLAHIGESLPDTHDLHIELMDFRNNQLACSLTAPSIDRIDKLSTQLMQKGLAVKPENITAVGNKVTGTLIISEGRES